MSLALRLQVRRDARKIAIDYVRSHRKCTEPELEQVVLAAMVLKAKAGDYGTLADDKDWDAFFSALAEFLEAILPLILELIEAFGAV